ncbi:MAG: c-type cytochrome [Alphaproteobacteria bacterium]|nr:c-type cytochrome [Alphaproteobacteria bacterium]
MARDQGPFKLTNPWPKIGWWSAAALLAVSSILGFLVLARVQQNGPDLGTWDAICRALGITSDSAPAFAAQPPLRTPTRIAWTPQTLAQVAAGDANAGAFVALNCGACHGEDGVSKSSLIPTLAGLDRTVIFKQLDDYRSGKRLWGVMSAIATALSAEDSANVAAWFASRTGGLLPVRNEGLPENVRSLRQTDPALRLVFAGEPTRGIPPCGACHGPGDQKLGAPSLNGQHASYIQRQLTAFAQGARQNDINAQMRTIAAKLTSEEIQAVAAYYAAKREQRPQESGAKAAQK